MRTCFASLHLAVLAGRAWLLRWPWLKCRPDADVVVSAAALRYCRFIIRWRASRVEFVSVHRHARLASGGQSRRALANFEDSFSDRFMRSQGPYTRRAVWHPLRSRTRNFELPRLAVGVLPPCGTAQVEPRSALRVDLPFRAAPHFIACLPFCSCLRLIAAASSSATHSRLSHAVVLPFVPRFVRRS